SAQKARADQIKADLANTERAILDANNKVNELERQLPEIQAQLEIARERVEAALIQQQIVADKLAAAEAQDRAISAEIAADEARIEELRITVAAIARESYRDSGNQTGLGVVFGSTSSTQFVDD